MVHMVYTRTTDRLGEVVAAEFERAGWTSLRRAADVTGIKRLTLTRRLESGGFTVAELEMVANALGTTVTALVQQAEAAA